MSEFNSVNLIPKEKFQPTAEYPTYEAYLEKMNSVFVEQPVENSVETPVSGNTWKPMGLELSKPQAAPAAAEVATASTLDDSVDWISGDIVETANKTKTKTDINKKTVEGTTTKQTAEDAYYEALAKNKFMFGEKDAKGNQIIRSEKEFMDRVNKLHFPFRRVHPQLQVICFMPTFRAAGTPVPTEISILRRDSEGWKRFLREKQAVR
jgi:hypothetical protein